MSVCETVKERNLRAHKLFCIKGLNSWLCIIILDHISYYITCNPMKLDF